jgi:hypothetical protein
VVVVQDNAEHRVREGLGDLALNLDGLFFVARRRNLASWIGRADGAPDGCNPPARL